jgi:hypothetical protein
VAIYAFANAALAERYVHHRLGAGVVVTVVYGLGLLAVPMVVDALPRSWLRGEVFVAGMVAITLVSVALFIRVNPHHLDVDRWSAITAFWHAAVHGDFPYAARSHLGGYSGQFPFFFLLVLPVYPLGEVGLLPLATWLVTLGAAWRWSARRDAFVVLALTSAGAAMWWEIAVRSNLFFNMALVLPVLVLLLRRPPATSGRVAVAAVATGLVLSTRGVVAVPLVAGMTSALWWCRGAAPVAWRDSGRALKRALGPLVLFGAITLGVFALTFVPLLAWGLGDLRAYNPFKFQARFVPAGAYVAAVIAAVAWAGRSPRLATVALRSAVIVLGLVLVHIVQGIADQGLQDAFYGGRVDVSFLIFPLPLALAALAAPEPTPSTQHEELASEPVG